VLLWRELLSVTRNPADVAGRCLIFTWLAVFVGLIFYNLPTTVDSLRSRMNVLFVEPVILLLMPYVYMSLFTSDKQYFIQGEAQPQGFWVTARQYKQYYGRHYNNRQCNSSRVGCTQGTLRSTILGSAFQSALSPLWISVRVAAWNPTVLCQCATPSICTPLFDSPAPAPPACPPPLPDVSAKLYSPSAYYVAKQLAVLPFAVLNSLLFAFTLYGLAGLRHNLVSVGQNGLMSVMIYLIAAQVCEGVWGCGRGWERMRERGGEGQGEEGDGGLRGTGAMCRA
jgi:hypothetical protein